MRRPTVAAEEVRVAGGREAVLSIAEAHAAQGRVVFAIARRACDVQLSAKLVGELRCEEGWHLPAASAQAAAVVPSRTSYARTYLDAHLDALSRRGALE